MADKVSSQTLSSLVAGAPPDNMARVKGNISKMIAQGALEADIDAYIAGEGVSLPELNGRQQETLASDAGKSLDAGVAKGVAAIGGAVGDLSDLGARGIGAATNWIERKIGLPESAPYDPQASVLRHLPTSKSMSEAIQRDYYGGEKPYESQSKAGKLAHAIGEFAPSAAVGPGGVIAKGIATVGGGVGQVYGGDAAAALLGEKARPYGEFLGGAVGVLTPGGAARTITPNPIRPERQRLIDLLRDEGVTSMTAGQQTGSKRLQYLEDAAGNSPGAGRGAERITREGQDQFTEAAMRRTGAGPTAAPEVLAANQARLGQSFEDLSARNTLVPDNRFITDITQAVRNYRNVPDSQQRAMIQGYIDDIIPYVNQGAMPGVEYQHMRSRMSRQANNNRQSDPDLSEALRDFRNALDNAMTRSIPPGSQDAQLWAQTRQQYGAQKDVEKAASRAGEATAEGQIVPANLRNVAAANNRGAYARGEGQFSELARAGSGIMSPLPNSGTAQRYNAFQLLNQLTAGAVPAATGRALMSRPVQSYLANQLMTGQLENLPPARQALIRALLAQDRSQMLAAPSN